MQKTERFSFMLTAKLVLGTPSEFVARQSPSVNLNVDRIVANAPCPKFVEVEIRLPPKLDEKAKSFDAWEASPLNGGISATTLLSVDRVGRAEMHGKYSGLCPPGFVFGSSFVFCVSFKGTSDPAEVAKFYRSLG